MSIHKTEAIVLNRRDFRETSIIASLFTSDFGKISGIFKGIRQEPGKFASSMEPFSLNEIVFYRKTNSSLHLVSQADCRNNFFSVRQDIQKIGVASSIIELLEAVMQPEDPNIGIFNLAKTSLQELEINSNPEKIMTIFTIKFLAMSGFKPHFDSCVSCGIKIMSHSKFSLVLGGLLCPKCEHKDMGARTIFRGTVASILHIERNDFKNNLNLGMNPQIKRELGAILNAFLNFHLERELKSQRVMNKISVDYAQRELV